MSAASGSSPVGRATGQRSCPPRRRWILRQPFPRSSATLYRVGVLLLLLGGPLPSCSSNGEGSGDPEPESLTVRVLSSFPHDRGAFTQGLLWHEGKLFESTGLNGSSSLRQVNMRTGVVERKVDLEDRFFGEGLTLIGDRLIQLTFRNETALVWNLGSFERVGQYEYQGEGWGLCYDGQRLIMTDGSSQLSFRDPASFELLGRVNVLMNGDPVVRLNELECVDGQVYANIWMTDTIVRIDPAFGEVTARIDASGLLSAEEKPGSDVLNGIAYLPESKTFLITGKLWPRLFEVEFVSAGSISQVDAGGAAASH